MLSGMGRGKERVLVNVLSVCARVLKCTRVYVWNRGLPWTTFRIKVCLHLHLISEHCSIDNSIIHKTFPQISITSGERQGHLTAMAFSSHFATHMYTYTGILTKWGPFPKYNFVNLVDREIKMGDIFNFPQESWPGFQMHSVQEPYI